MLAIHLFGQFRLYADEKQSDWLPLPKTTSLLAYLLLHRSTATLTREQVAFALWPDVAADAARSNLRRHLYDLQKHLPAEEPDRPWLLRDRRTVRWNPEIDLRLDVAEFEADISQPETLTRAVSHYTGPLLPDVDEEWLLPLRAELHNRYLAGLETLVATHQSQGAHQEAYAWAERLLAEDPLREDVVQTMLQLAEDLDERSSVLLIYQRFQALLAEEIGVPPSPETEALAARLTPKRPVPTGRSSEQQTPLPPQQIARTSSPLLIDQVPEMVASFTGREQELDAIEERLQTPNGRLITITGPGGIGKTSLALAVAHRVQKQFADGVHFVELANLDESDSVLTAIIERLQQPFSGELDPVRQLTDFLHEKRLLLVLDNLEHLMAQAGLLTRLLQAIPGLQLLATSRIRLHQPGETVFGLQGLAVPEESVALASDDLAQFAGVQLFIERAQQALWDFIPDESDLATISQICRYLEGVPLAIELAAPWVKMLPVADILLALQEDPNILAAQVSNTPRHESMRAVFAQSWSYLSSREQKLCRALSVFRGGFTAPAAQTVCQTSLPPLVSLTDKSFLSARLDRFRMHELLRQFAGEHLATEQDEYAAVRNRQRDFYLGFLRERLDHLRGADPSGTAQELDEEIDNIRAGWRWAVANDQHEALAGCVPALFEYYALRNLYQDGIDFFEATLESLPKQLPDGEPGIPLRQLRAELLACTGDLNDRIGDRTKSLDLINASLEIMDGSWRFVEIRAYALWRLGYVLQQAGRFAEADRALQESLRLYTHQGDGSRRAAVQNVLGIVCAQQGDPDAALALFQEALRGAREAQDLVTIERTTQNLATCHSIIGMFEQAKAYYDETIRYAKLLGDKATLARVYSSLGGMYLDQEEYGAAIHYETLAVEFSVENGFRSADALARAGLGMAFAGKGDYPSAAQQLAKAIQVAMDCESHLALVQALVNAASTLIHYQARTLAQEALQTVIDSSASADYLRDRAQRLLGELEMDSASGTEEASSIPPVADVANKVQKFLARQV